jgi:hypothetical protein
MSRDFKCHPLDDFNGSADYWLYRIGVNIIPADTRNKANYQAGQDVKISQYLTNHRMNGKRLLHLAEV